MNLELFIDNNLLNKNKKLEGQRLTENWFYKKNFTKEFEYFQKHNILNSKNLYTYLYDINDLCECGNMKRFIGFRDGFKKYCNNCSRTKYNYMKRQGTKEKQLNNIINFVKDKKNNYSISKIKKLSDKTIKLVENRTKYLDIAKISERLYHIEHNLYKLPNCRLCGKEHNNFKYSNHGYFNYCKFKCSYKYNSDVRRESIRRNHYEKYKEKYKSTNDYDIRLFTLDEYLNSSNCFVDFTHNKCNHKYTLPLKYQGHLKCPKCYPIRSKIQYEIFEWLSEFKKSKFNDRQFIKPLELDILTDTFAIEYDSLMFHSTGKSKLGMFNNLIENRNYHMNKTELCEEHNLQLFRIFSNEWINKQYIWKSVIKSKLGITKKIFARKCSIEEISAAKSKEFLVKNHLQGSINSKVKIGLFYNSEIVSVMTFGKSRRSKWKGENKYELYRFCTKLNYTVVGGASKLLKYFERKYKPRCIISYANRRWSTGNLYNKIGFKFIENTTPNYFYFKGGDNSILLSRESFQKHKLKDKLKIFDPDLTETDNMFNNNYRKIFDCGNMVYVKHYDTYI